MAEMVKAFEWLKDEVVNRDHDHVECRVPTWLRW